MTATLDAACNLWGLTVIKVDFPEDARPLLPARPVDAIATTTDGTVVVEHTIFESFSEQITDGERLVRKLDRFVRDISGTLPGPGRYELGVESGAIAGHSQTDLAPLEAWIRRETPKRRATQHWPWRGHVARAEPPEVPFPVSLMVFEASERRPAGSLDLRREIDLDELPALQAEQTGRVLARKLPKLEEHRPRHGRTLLIFEQPDTQLVNTGSATRAIHSALAADVVIPEPDAIVLVYTFDRWGLDWIKDSDGWFSRLGRSTDWTLSGPQPV